MTRWLLLFLLLWNGFASAAPVAIGEKLPDTKMDGLNGPARGLASYRGQRLIINVWASWCGPCRQEMASLNRLAWSYGDKFTIIGISTDDYRDKAQAFLGKANTTFTHYIDHDLVLEKLLGADRLPLTLLIDRDGTVLARHYGAREWDAAEALQFIGKTYRLKL
jgi:thiol-disulfide isomerase/thioredoxin